MVEDSTVGDPAALIPAVLARIEEPSPAKTELDARTYPEVVCFDSRLV